MIKIKPLQDITLTITVPQGATIDTVCNKLVKKLKGEYEIVESEDERIRKWLIAEIKATHDYDSPTSAKCVDDAIAWLEKQKEHQPYIELIQRSWYLEGYHDREFGKEPKWIIKTGEGGPEYEENPKYGQMLKEQKPDIFGDTLSDSIPDDWRTKISTNDSSNAPELKAENMDDVEACMLRYLQSASNRKDDDDIMEDTRKYKQELFELMQKPAEWSEGEKEDRIRDIVAAVNNFYNEPMAKELVDFLKLLYHGVEDEYGQEMLAVAYSAILDNIPVSKRSKEINDALAFMRTYTGIALPQPKQEIKRQKSIIAPLFTKGDDSPYDGENDAYDHLLSYIESLEKENRGNSPEIPSNSPNVDLDKEIDKFMESVNNEATIDETAKYFYELGLNARKED